MQKKLGPQAEDKHLLAVQLDLPQNSKLGCDRAIDIMLYKMYVTEIPDANIADILGGHQTNVSHHDLNLKSVKVAMNQALKLVPLIQGTRIHLFNVLTRPIDEVINHVLKVDR